MKLIATILGVGMLVTILGGYLFVSNYGIDGSGVSKSIQPEVETFDKISLEGIGTINIYSGDTSGITITTDDNLLEYIETTVEDGRLTISQSEALNPKTALVFDITIAELTDVDVAGSATVNFHDIETPSLDISVAGACRIAGSGTIESLSIDLAGACRANLRELKASRTKVDLAGTGSATVYASESIDASVAGFGSITCYGNPRDIQKDASGISKITIAKR